jgi:hypothetical protein
LYDVGMNDKPPEDATERAWIMISPELLAMLEKDWSVPCQIKARRPSRPGEPWELDVRTEIGWGTL